MQTSIAFIVGTLTALGLPVLLLKGILTDVAALVGVICLAGITSFAATLPFKRQTPMLLSSVATGIIVCTLVSAVVGWKYGEAELKKNKHRGGHGIEGLAMPCGCMTGAGGGFVIGGLIGLAVGMVRRPETKTKKKPSRKPIGDDSDNAEL